MELLELLCGFNLRGEPSLFIFYEEEISSHNQGIDPVIEAKISHEL